MTNAAYAAVKAESMELVGPALRSGIEFLGTTGTGVARKLRRFTGNRMAVTAVVALAPTIAITVTALLLKDHLAGASEVG